MSVEGINLDDPRVPQKWKPEMIAGTVFGIKAIEAIKRMQGVAVVRPTCPPNVSNVGTLIMQAIEQSIGGTISCGPCRGYLARLNRTAEHDVEVITQWLSANLAWPAEWKAKNTRRREAISAMITPIIEQEKSK